MTGGVNTLAWQYISPLDSLAWQYFSSCSSYLSSYSFLSGPVSWSNSCLVTSFSFFVFFSIFVCHYTWAISDPVGAVAFPGLILFYPWASRNPPLTGSLHHLTGTFKNRDSVLPQHCIMVADKATKNSDEGEILACRQLLQFFFFICLFVSRELADSVLAGMCTEAVQRLSGCLLFTFATGDYIRLSCAHFQGTLRLCWRSCGRHWSVDQRMMSCFCPLCGPLNPSTGAQWRCAWLPWPLFFSLQKIINLVKKTKTELRLYYLQMLLHLVILPC